jgi:hypothetical protein
VNLTELAIIRKFGEVRCGEVRDTAYQSNIPKWLDALIFKHPVFNLVTTSEIREIHKLD